MQQPPRSPFRERVGTYLLGVAIGCVIVGFILMGRYQSMRQQAAQQPALVNPPTSAASPR